MAGKRHEIDILNYEDQNYYELLDIDYQASPEEIKRAYQFTVKVFGSQSMATYSLFTNQQRERVLSRVDEAYKTLIDSQKRKKYDEDLLKAGKWKKRPLSPSMDFLKGAEGAQKEVHGRQDVHILSDEKRNLISSTIISIESETGYNGPALRKIRELKGITLDEISSKTKINKNYLAFIEEERYELLPPEVYLKGFLSQVAKMLGLDPQKVTGDYMEMMRSRRVKK